MKVWVDFGRVIEYAELNDVLGIFSFIYGPTLVISDSGDVTRSMHDVGCDVDALSILNLELWHETMFY